MTRERQYKYKEYKIILTNLTKQKTIYFIKRTYKLTRTSNNNNNRKISIYFIKKTERLSKTINKYIS